MSISFECQNCQEKIVVNHLMPGELAVCKNCKNKVIVPDKSETSTTSEFTQSQTNRYNLSIGTQKQNNLSSPQGISVTQVKTFEQQFSKILLYLSIGLIFHIFEYKFFLIDSKSGNVMAIINLSIIGVLFFLYASVQAYKLRLYKQIFVPLIVFCSISTIIYLLELFGLVSTYIYLLKIIEIVILLILYYKIIYTIEIFKNFVRYYTILTTLLICDIILYGISIVSQPILIQINRLFSNSDFYLVMFNIFGMLLPILFIQFVAMLMLTYISFAMYRTYNKTYNRN